MKQSVLFTTGLVAGAALATLAHRPLIKYLETDPTYRVLTRAAAELRLRFRRSGFDLVLLDVDGMKALNTQFGYDEINRRIRAALTAVELRQGDMLWRHFSGDELGAATGAGNGHGIAARLIYALEAQGLTACVHVEHVRNLRRAILAAEQALLQLKAQRPLAVAS